jgi:signal peptidase II
MGARRASSGGSPGLALWLGLALIVILADQVTKTLILGAFQHGDVRPVTDWFNLVRVHNTGAAFSFLAGASGWQRWFFVGLGLAARPSSSGCCAATRRRSCSASRSA